MTSKWLMYNEYLFLKLNHELQFHQYNYSKESHKDIGKVWVLHLEMSMVEEKSFWVPFHSTVC
jgi:hypothetical protein